MLALEDDETLAPRRRRNVGRRVDENRDELWIDVRISMENEAARLGGNRDPNVVIQLESAAAL